MIALLLFAGALPNSNIGAEACKSCHPQAYSTWAESAHARAHLTLSEQERKETRCLLCHSLGADTQAEDQSRFTGVQCESCHGGGRYYSASYVMKDKVLARAVGLSTVGEAVCKHCHDSASPSLQPFDYKTAWARIAHGKN